MFDLLLHIKTKYLGDSDYKKNVMIMVGGRIIAQAIPILLTPLLTRIYSPEEFGIFAVYATIVFVIAMASHGRYCLAIILPKSEEKAQKLVFLSNLLTLVTTSFFGILMFFFSESIFSLLNVSVLKTFTLVLFLNILFLGFYDSFFYYALRVKKYKLLAFNIICQATILILVRLGLGYMGFTESGLLFSYFISTFFAFLLLFWSLKIKWGKSLSFYELKMLLREYINFPKFSLLGDSLSVLTNNSPNIFLNKIFGSVVTGHYSISEKILGAPIWFVTSSVGDVFKQEASENYREEGSCKNIFVKTTRSLFLLGIIPFVLIFIFAPPLVPIIFGEGWEPTGIYIRIFSVMYFSSFVISPTSYVIYIVNKQKFSIIFQGLKFSCILLAFGIGFYYNNLILTLILWSSLITLANIFIFYISYKFAHESKYVEVDETEVEEIKN